MDMTQLESFVSLAETLNYSKAAGRLCTTQSALSKRIKQLEAQLGFALFERTTRGTALTDAGASFYRTVVVVLADLDAGIARARKLDGHRARVLRVGGDFANQHIQNAAMRVQALAAGQEPPLRVEIDRHHLSARIMDLRQHPPLAELAEGVDDAVVVYLGEATDAPELEVVPLFREDLRFFARSDSGFADGQQVDLADLEPLTFIREKDCDGFYNRLEAICRSCGFEPRMRLTCHESYNELYRDLRPGEVVAVTEASISHIDEFAVQGLVTLVPRDEAAHFDVGLVYRTEDATEIAPLVAMFRQVVAEEARGDTDA